MGKFSFTNRVWFIFFDLILVMITVISFYFGIKRIIVYFSYPDFLVFSIFSIFSVLFFMISTPILILSFSPIFRGIQANTNLQMKIAKLIKLGLLFIVLSSLVFNLFYLSLMSNKGYIKCNGTPSGWMPVMANKYAIDEHLCKKKDP